MHVFLLNVILFEHVRVVASLKVVVFKLLLAHPLLGRGLLDFGRLGIDGRFAILTLYLSSFSLLSSLEDLCLVLSLFIDGSLILEVIAVSHTVKN